MHFAVVHIVRIAGGKIVGLWDLGQEIPKDSPNALGMFQPLAAKVRRWICCVALVFLDIAGLPGLVYPCARVFPLVIGKGHATRQRCLSRE